MNIPSISVLVPCRNEQDFIGPCLDSIISNNYPHDKMEIIVIDGMSEDKSNPILSEYSRRFPFIKLISNPKKFQAPGLNLGIQSAKGDVLLRVDAHATCEKDYILKCVQALNTHKADNVGGIWDIIPRKNTFIGKSIVQSITHRFGVGNAYYRFKDIKEVSQVDTVPFFCFKKTIVNKVGLFNEQLERSEDIEFNRRLKSVGGRTILIPEIVSRYYARSDFSSFIKHNWINGLWAVLPFMYTKHMPVSIRHLIPLFFVSSLAAFSILSAFTPIGTWLLIGILVPYLAINILSSIQVAWKNRSFFSLLFMPFVFLTLHLSYGLGSVWGSIKVIYRSIFEKKT